MPEKLPFVDPEVPKKQREIIREFFKNKPFAELELSYKGKFRGCPDCLPENIKAFIEESNLPEKLAANLGIIVDELAANAISYGFEEEAINEIKISIVVKGKIVVLIFKDSGSAFNPLELEAPDTEAIPEDRIIGGLGVHLIKKLTQSQKYERVDGKNVLTLEIPFPEETNSAKSAPQPQRN
ncbi:MAG: ATP-binding protein [Patescibacteria group bacterium]